MSAASSAESTASASEATATAEATTTHASIGKAAVTAAARMHTPERSAIPHASSARVPTEVHAAGVGHPIGVALAGRTERAWLPRLRSHEPGQHRHVCQ